MPKKLRFSLRTLMAASSLVAVLFSTATTFQSRGVGEAFFHSPFVLAAGAAYVLLCAAIGNALLRSRVVTVLSALFGGGTWLGMLAALAGGEADLALLALPIVVIAIATVAISISAFVPTTQAPSPSEPQEVISRLLAQKKTASRPQSHAPEGSSSSGLDE